MITVLSAIMLGGLLLVFATHLTYRLEGDELFPFWLWSLSVLLLGMLGIAVFFPESESFGVSLSLAMSAFGLAGIIKTLPKQ